MELSDVQHLVVENTAHAKQLRKSADQWEDIATARVREIPFDTLRERLVGIPASEWSYVDNNPQTGSPRFYKTTNVSPFRITLHDRRMCVEWGDHGDTHFYNDPIQEIQNLYGHVTSLGVETEFKPEAKE